MQERLPPVNVSNSARDKPRQSPDKPHLPRDASSSSYVKSVFFLFSRVIVWFLLKRSKRDTHRQGSSRMSAPCGVSDSSGM